MINPADFKTLDEMKAMSKKKLNQLALRYQQEILRNQDSLLKLQGQMTEAENQIKQLQKTVIDLERDKNTLQQRILEKDQAIAAAGGGTLSRPSDLLGFLLWM